LEDMPDHCYGIYSDRAGALEKRADGKPVFRRELMGGGVFFEGLEERAPGQYMLCLGS
jgi:hypothetical protein